MFGKVLKELRTERQLRRWRDAAKRHGENAFPGQGNARDKELMRLKRKLAKVEQELGF